MTNRLSLEQIALGVVGVLVAGMFGLLTPRLAARLEPQPSPVPTIAATAPPAGVLLEEELDHDLQGVVTVVADGQFATAFAIDPKGDLLTAAHLIKGARAMRVVDNSGGSHAVRLIGIDNDLDLAEIRADAMAQPLAFGDSSTIKLNDPLVMLASPKNATLPSSTPVTVTGIDGEHLSLAADTRPSNAGAPLVGAGGKVLGIALGGGENEVLKGTGLTVQAALNDLAHWQGLAGTAVALAPLPDQLILHGSDEIAALLPTVGVLSVQPASGSGKSPVLVTIQGQGFVRGPALRVRFTPVASPTGGFDGVGPIVVDGATITVKVPEGQVVQDYVVEVINGDGSIAASRIAYTVTL